MWLVCCACIASWFLFTNSFGWYVVPVLPHGSFSLIVVVGMLCLYCLMVPFTNSCGWYVVPVLPHGSFSLIVGVGMLCLYCMPHPLVFITVSSYIDTNWVQEILHFYVCTAHAAKKWKVNQDEKPFIFCYWHLKLVTKQVFPGVLFYLTT